MYELFATDKNASAWNFGCSSGDTESSNAVQKNEGARITNENSVLFRNRSKSKEGNRDISVELENFLHYRSCIANNREMVAQDMAQSYNELLHATQQPQEFITLKELSPHGRSISTSNNSSNIYPGSQSEGHRHQSHQQQQQQERTYYNLSALSESCTEVYFDEIRHETNCRLPGSDPLAPTATLAPSLSPGSVDIHEQHSTSTNDDSGIKNNHNLISIAHPTIVPIRPNVNNNKKNTINNIPSLILHDSNNDERNVDSRTNENSVERPPKSVIESCSHANRRLNPAIPMQIDAQSSSSSHRTHSHRHHNNNSHQHHHLHTHQHQNHHHHHLRNYQDTTDAPICITSPDTQEENLPESKKRKVSCHDDSDSMDDTADDVKSVRTNTDNKKQNHSEIEKRRRDKMNTYITELSAMVPMCHAMSRKLDKLTVLRMAVQHLKTILGAVTSYTEGHFKPTFLSDQELKTLILQAADGFVFVVGCDRGRILYVSESVARTLNYSQDDLLGQSWFDILHPKDVAKVKEQLSSSDLSPREKLIDAKTMLPVKTDVPQGVSRLCSGARRSFFCRMKRKVDSSTSCNESQVKEEVEISPGCHRRKKQQSTDWKYCVIQCTGYLKSWAPAKIGLDEQENEGDGDGCNLSCLVAVGRIQPQLQLYSMDAKTPKLRTIEFVSRHAIDGKILFIDQRATLVLGFLPQELLGTSMYEYYHHDDIPHLAESHKTTLQTSELVTTQMYRFRTKGATFVRLQSGWKSFRNPWTKDIEYLIAKNSAVLCDGRIVESNAQRLDGPNVQGNYDFFAQSNGSLERLISSQVEVSKIGRRIAEEVLDHQRRSEDSSSGESPSPAQEHVLVNTKITATASPEIMRDSTQSGIGSSDNSSSNPTTNYNQIRNNITLNNSVNDPGPGTEEDMMDIIGSNRMTESPNPLPSDGNDEAAMAVIMSLLEADAGLGGPVDFSGLPWPLP